MTCEVCQIRSTPGPKNSFCQECFDIMMVASNDQMEAWRLEFVGIVNRYIDHCNLPHKACCETH